MNEDNTEGDLNNMNTEVPRGSSLETSRLIGNVSGSGDEGGGARPNQERNAGLPQPPAGAGMSNLGIPNEQLIDWVNQLGNHYARRLRVAEETDQEDPEAAMGLQRVISMAPPNADALLNNSAAMDRMAAARGRGGVDQADMYGITREMYEAADRAEALDPEGQIEYVSDLMSKLEATKQSYGSLQSNPEFVILIRNLHKLKRETQQYFKGRYTIYETWLKLPYAGGDIGAFTKTVEGASSLELQATMLSRPEVAQAMMVLEESSRQFENLPPEPDPDRPGHMRPNPKNNRPTGDNIAFASPQELERQRENIAAELGQRNGITDRSEAVAKYIWAVRQADTMHRMWFRAGKEDGLVFKSHVSEAQKQEILSLNPKEVAERWDEVLEAVNLNKASFSGNGEFAIKRILYSHLFLQNSARGESRIRRYVTFGSRDFLSYKLDAKFLKDKNSFTEPNAQAFTEELVIYKDGDNVIEAPFSEALLKEKGKKVIGTVYAKTDPDVPNRMQRVLIRRNGNWDIYTLKNAGPNETGSFRFDKVNWKSMEEDVFPNDFYYRQADLAEAVRKATMGADKILRDPKLEKILGLGGELENFAPIQEAIEKEWHKGKFRKEDGSINWKEGMKWIKDERKGGVLYREDVIGMLARGLLEFQHSGDFKRRYGQPKIDWRGIDLAVRALQGNGLLDTKAASQLRRDLLAFDGMPAHEFVAHLMVSAHYTKPHEMFFEMFFEFFRQISRSK